MKQTLNLRLGQHLTMTPQLQHAIKLLQMSTLELQQEIQQALESNIMLEITDDEGGSREGVSTSEKKLENTDSFTSEGSQTNIPDELPVDSSWDDIYESSAAPSSGNNETIEFESQRSNSSTLLDHLLWRVPNKDFSITQYNRQYT